MLALGLDLDCQPRTNCQGTGIVHVHNKKQAKENERMMALFTAKLWEWKDPNLHCKARKRIARAACRQVGYDFGYSNELASSMLPTWESMVTTAIQTGENDAACTSNPLSPRHCGKKNTASSLKKRTRDTSVSYFDTRRGQRVLRQPTKSLQTK